MKRSEAIKLIEEYLEYRAFHGVSPYWDSRELLKKLEEAGILNGTYTWDEE